MLATTHVERRCCHPACVCRAPCMSAEVAAIQIIGVHASYNSSARPCPTQVCIWEANTVALSACHRHAPRRQRMHRGMPCTDKHPGSECISACFPPTCIPPGSAYIRTCRALMFTQAGNASDPASHQHAPGQRTHRSLLDPH